MQEKETLVGLLLGTVLPIIGGVVCASVAYAFTGSRLLSFLVVLRGGLAVQWSFCLLLVALANLLDSRKRPIGQGVSLRPVSGDGRVAEMPKSPTVHDAILEAERFLPGRAEDDSRWQAIIKVGEFIQSDPIPVCEFALKWARRPGADLRSALWCCLFEHLLEHHFDLVLPRIRTAARVNRQVAECFSTVSTVWLLGQSAQPKNVARLKRLARGLRHRHAIPTA